MTDVEHGKDGRPASSALDRLPWRAYWMIALVALGMLGAWIVLEIQAGVTAYVNAEGLWSKMQKQSVLALYRYADSGDPRDLAEARQALKTPLEDLAFRDALEHDPPDVAAGRRHLVNAGNRAEDIERLLWIYRYLADAPYLRDSVHAWKSTDADLALLTEHADAMEERLDRGSVDAAVAAGYKRQLNDINARIYPHTVAFSDSLARGASAIRGLLLVFSVVAYTLLVLYALWVLRRTLRHVRETENEFQMAFHQSAVGMLTLDMEGRCSQANEALAKILGIPQAQLLGGQVQDVMLPGDLARTDDGKLDWSRFADTGETRVPSRDRGMRWVRWTASWIPARERGKESVFLLVEDITEARTLAREIAYQASHDPLTELINRREIEKRLYEALTQVREGEGPHVLCYLDIDQFKLVNDTSGHAAGDLYLQRFANTIVSQLRPGDWLGRLGGDEFALLLRDVDLDRGEAEVARLHSLLAQTTFAFRERSFAMHFSAGLVEITAGSAGAGWLLGAADSACYLAKQEGGRRIHRYNDADQALARRREDLDWVANARAAMADRRLVLYAQRIVPLEGDAPLRYELLVRMRDGEGALQPPAKFLGAMERYGQAIEVDRYVFDAALAEFERSPAHLAELGLCHINVSAQSIADPSFLDFVRERLDRHPDIARKLCFEITETAAVGNMEDARRFIDAVRSRGCRVALDDFGIGLSSFAYLKNLPVDIVKIDSMFVRNIGSVDSDLAMVRSMGEIADALGKSTIAEGVESADILQHLARIGIHAAQGYAVHMPCPLEELSAGSR